VVCRYSSRARGATWPPSVKQDGSAQQEDQPEIRSEMPHPDRREEERQATGEGGQQNRFIRTGIQ